MFRPSLPPSGGAANQTEDRRHNNAENTDHADETLQKNRILPSEHVSIVNCLKRESEKTHELQGKPLERVIAAHEVLKQGRRRNALAVDDEENHRDDRGVRDRLLVILDEI